jgi:hypothetical protein
MKITTITVLSIIFCSACAVPSHYKPNEISTHGNFSCLTPQREMMLTMPFNVCPMLSSAPMAKGKYWKTSNFSDRFSKADIATRSTVRQIKNCSARAKTMQLYLVTPGEKFNVSHYKTRSDTVRPNRLFAYGSYGKNGQILPWSHEFMANNLEDKAQRVMLDFEVCGK